MKTQSVSEAPVQTIANPVLCDSNISLASSASSVADRIAFWGSQIVPLTERCVELALHGKVPSATFPFMRQFHKELKVKVYTHSSTFHLTEHWSPARRLGESAASFRRFAFGAATDLLFGSL